jgi:geranylgeranyl pyrophosphate synthase
LVHDYLGIWENIDTTGKSATSDLVDRKITYPVLLGLAIDPDFSMKWKQEIDSPKEISSMISLSENGGVR